MELSAGHSDVLPVCISEVDRARFAATVNPSAVDLAPGADLGVPRTALRGDDRDLVISTGAASALAARYASVTGRPFVALPEAPDATPDLLPTARPRSVTWFGPRHAFDLATTVHALRQLFQRAWEVAPPLGLLTAESEAQLTWLLAKQLLDGPTGSESSVAVVNGTERRPVLGTVQALHDGDTVADVVEAFRRPATTVLVSGHSRPHCGMLKFQDGALGLCGHPDEGAHGTCVDGGACDFTDRPKVALQSLTAKRVFFNGCTTASDGKHRIGLPRAALLAHSALRGGAREYVGNVRPGAYGPLDLHWFLGLSALGYGPAACVAILDEVRRVTERVRVASCVYFGDATNGPWPASNDVRIGETFVNSDHAQVRWSAADRVSIARIPGRTWARLAMQDRLDVTHTRPDSPAVSIVEDPWADDSLVLVTSASDELDQPMVLDLRPLEKPIDRRAGDAIAAASVRVAALSRCPSFSSALATARVELEEQLANVRGLVEQRIDVALLRETTTLAREEEVEITRSYDARMVEAALARVRTPWDIPAELGAGLKLVERAEPTRCPGCGAFAMTRDGRALAWPEVVRVQTWCAECGFVHDMPTWPLETRIEAFSCELAALRATVTITSHDVRERVVEVGFAAAGTGPVEPTSVERARLVVSPGQTARFDAVLHRARPYSGFTPLRAFLACEGAFGAAGTSLVVGGLATPNPRPEKLALRGP